MSAFNPRELLDSANRSERPANDEEELPRMGFFQHLEELRKRVIWALLATLIGAIGCYNTSEYLFELLIRPLSGAGSEAV